MHIPIGAESDFVGVIDLIQLKAHIWTKDDGSEWDVNELDEKQKDIAQKKRAELLDVVAEADDKVLEKYLNDEEISEEEFKTAVR